MDARLTAGIAARRPQAFPRAGRSRARPASGHWTGIATTASADEVAIDLRAVPGDHVAKALLVSEGEGGKVEERVALRRLGPVDDAGDLITCEKDVVDLQVAVDEDRRPRPERRFGEPAVACDHVGRKDVVGDEPLALARGRDASSSRLLPVHGGSGASCSVLTAAPAAAHASTTRWMARRGGRVPSPEERQERARAASATGSPESAPAPSPSPRPRHRYGSGQRRSSGTRRRRAESRARCERRRPRPPPRRPSSQRYHRPRRVSRVRLRPGSYVDTPQTNSTTSSVRGDAAAGVPPE